MQRDCTRCRRPFALADLSLVPVVGGGCALRRLEAEPFWVECAGAFDVLQQTLIQMAVYKLAA